MNDWLLKDISDEEIRNAVFSLGPYKSPGIDGFPAIFYQRHWDCIKANIIKEVREFWTEGKLDKDINKTLIVLIPKKKEALRIEDWRPISLCTVAVKIISKIIAQRLQPILNQIISMFQSAFVKGRIITDNFVVAHEIANFLKNCRDDHSFYASVKVDMSKAYDRVEWYFLEKLLLKMGFAEKWVGRVMSCVTSATYQIRVNEEISEVILPSRGLRQGDLLSPYLFLFCTELLNAKLLEGVSKGLISGVKICRMAPTISHLFFADDSIFFIKADPGEAGQLKSILNQYERASGQLINFEKSEISFSKNTPADIRMEVCDVLRVSQVRNHSKYLGIPLVVGQRKIEIFRDIVDKIWRKVKDWKHKFLSAGGREVLVKAVIQAIPTYMMSVYSFPRKIISEIYKLIRQFWWDKEDGRGISWVRQDILQKKKDEGGLGLKDLVAFNDAMLLKIGWRVVKFPNLLMSRILLAKYCRGGNIFDARLGNRPSHVWRGVMKSLGVLLEGLLWDEGRRTYRWRYSSNGIFSVKSAYDIIKEKSVCSRIGMVEQSDKQGLRKFWRIVWSANVPNKIKIFCWRLYHNSLPDAVNLGKRGVVLDMSCRICGFPVEDALHIVKECRWAKLLLSSFHLHIPIIHTELASSADWIWWGAMNLKAEDFQKFLGVLWLCWRNRNNVWHEKGSWSTCRAAIIGLSTLKAMQARHWQVPTLKAWFSDGWSPPPSGEIKINVDGAWEWSTREAGLGVVARDSSGAVLWCWSLQWNQGICASEIEGAGVSDWCDSWLGAAIVLVRSRPDWKVQLVNRETNGLADWLAYKARVQAWCWKRVDAIPLFPRVFL
ncbi:hypothetical protein QQ045_026497 [Rhodiola kirilowii]